MLEPTVQGVKISAVETVWKIRPVTFWMALVAGDVRVDGEDSNVSIVSICNDNVCSSFCAPLENLSVM